MQFCLWCSMHSNDDVYPSGNKVIMSTLSELYCRQTARIGGGGNCSPSRTPMIMGK